MPLDFLNLRVAQQCAPDGRVRLVPTASAPLVDAFRYRANVSAQYEAAHQFVHDQYRGPALAEVRRRPPEVVVFVDADRSDDPADLGALLAPFVAGWVPIARWMGAAMTALYVLYAWVALTVAI